MNNMSPLNHFLPEEISNKIEDMACKKIVNGTKKSNELILIFKLNETATNVHDKLMQWLFRCLDKISDKVFDGYQYNWSIISQIKDNDNEEEDDDDSNLDDNDYEEEDDDNNLDDKENCTKLTNTIMVAIHLPDDSWMSFNNDGLTIPYNYCPDMTLSPQDIMDCLIKEPVFIKEMGVSSVSSEVMMEWWKEMINTEPNICDVAGKGYMVHPMWRKYVGLSENQHIEWGDWSDVREQSFNFGWKGYMAKE